MCAFLALWQTLSGRASQRCMCQLCFVYATNQKRSYYLAYFTYILSGPSLCCISPAASDVLGLLQVDRVIMMTISEYEICYVLSTAGNGEFISVEFSSMVTECSYDFVFVYDGPTYHSPLLGSFSGGTKPDILISSSHYVSSTLSLSLQQWLNVSV